MIAALTLRSKHHGIALALLWLFVAVSIATSSATAQSYYPNAADKLEAVKQALVDLAIDTDVKIGSAAFLDSSGALHEASVLSSHNKVRGVRVLSYLEEAGITTAAIDTSMLSDTSCPGSRPDIRRQATIRVVLDSSNSSPNLRVGDHYTTELLALTEQVLQHSLATSEDWSVRSEVAHRTTYDRFVTGTSADRVPYRFELVLRDRNPLEALTKRRDRVRYYSHRLGHDVWDWTAAKLPVNHSQPWPAVPLEYELRLVDSVTGTPLWAGVTPLQYPKVDRGYSKAVIPIKFKREIEAATEQFIAELSASMDCHVEAYTLMPVSGSAGYAQINAGIIAGVKVGDQFLLSGDTDLLNEVLSSAGLNGLGLAQVVSVTAHSAALKLIAGPKWSDGTELRNRVALHL
jgi:hypothetical protein